MEAASLFVFNPEHDLALAVGEGPYTPPSEVAILKKDMALLPATFADNGDFILIPDDMPQTLDNLKFHDLCVAKNIQIITADRLKHIAPEIRKIIPWGWDYPLWKLLTDNGMSSKLLPLLENIHKIKVLSHRKATIPFRNKVCEHLGIKLLNPAKEISDPKELEEFLSFHPLAYLKAPWSSSGRGIIVSDHISPKGLREWAHGTIKRQGSLIAEPKWERKLDFATEWFVENNEASFMGYSVFRTSDRGKYHGNIEAPQNELLGIISDACKFNDDILEAQRFSINTFISPHYSGPLGIDMLADVEGNINHCVEINLRLTMGFIKIEKARNKLIGK